MKKKAKPSKRETSQEVIPQTLGDKVKENLEELLKKAGLARTAAIPLQGLEYADNLSSAIKKHADEVEKIYTSGIASLKASVDDKELNKLMKKVEEKTQATQKLQATFRVERRTSDVELLVVVDRTPGSSHLLDC